MKWQNKEISDMDVSHIKNTIAYMERQWDETDGCTPILYRDMYGDYEVDEVNFGSIQEMFPEYKFLKRELNKRNREEKELQSVLVKYGW